MRYIVEGSKVLSGKIHVRGSKNEALALLAAAIILRTKLIFVEVPDIVDIHHFLALSESFGVQSEYKDGLLYLDASNLHSGKLDNEILRKLRAGIYYLPILASISNEFEFGRTGGCALGKRPIDFHLMVLNSFGVKYTEKEDGYIFNVEKIKATTVHLPFPSFGATVNAVLLGCIANGTTTIINVAREPEIQKMLTFLRICGVDITDVGSTIVVVGKTKKKTPTRFNISPDRIVASTYITLGLLCGKSLEIENCPFDELKDYFNFLEQGKIKYTRRGKRIKVSKQDYCGNASICAQPYPGFSTDILPIIVPLLICGIGKSEISDEVYKDRFKYLDELKKYNADIVIEDKKLLFVQRVACALRISK